MKPCLALFFILASACATPQLAHIVTEMAFNIAAVITHSLAGVHQYTVGAMMPHPVNLVVPGSAIAPITYICLLSLTTVDMTVRGFTVLDVANNPSSCQRSSSPPPAAYAPAREKRETKSFTDWQLQYPCTFGDLSAGLAPACRNPVARVRLCLGAYQVKSEKRHKEKNQENQKKTAQSVSRNMSFFPLLLLSIAAFCM